MPSTIIGKAPAAAIVVATIVPIDACILRLRQFGMAGARARTLAVVFTVSPSINGGIAALAQTRAALTGGLQPI